MRVELDAPEAEAVEVMTALATGALIEEKLASWLRSRMTPTSAPESA